MKGGLYLKSKAKKSINHTKISLGLHTVLFVLKLLPDQSSNMARNDAMGKFATPYQNRYRMCHGFVQAYHGYGGLILGLRQ